MFASFFGGEVHKPLPFGSFLAFAQSFWKLEVSTDSVGQKSSEFGRFFPSQPRVQGEGVEAWGTLRIPFGKIGEP